MALPPSSQDYSQSPTEQQALDGLHRFGPDILWYSLAVPSGIWARRLGKPSQRMLFSYTLDLASNFEMS